MFLAPPWGGPSYKTIKNFTLDLLKPKDGYVVMLLPIHLSTERKVKPFRSFAIQSQMQSHFDGLKRESKLYFL